MVNKKDAVCVCDSLTEAGFFFTKLATSGGFLKEGNTTLLIGVDDEKVHDALEVIRLHCLKRTEAAPMMMGAEASNIAAFSYTAPADCCRRRYGIRYKRRTVRKILTANIPQMQGSQPSLPGFPHRHKETVRSQSFPLLRTFRLCLLMYGFIYMDDLHIRCRMTVQHIL